MRKNRLCGETVTLYHPDPTAQTVCRRVLRGVSWQQGRREKPDATGTKQGTALLLVIPEAAGQYGADYTLDPGDRVLLGEGPAWPGPIGPALCPLLWRGWRLWPMCCRCACADGCIMWRPVPGGTPAAPGPTA